MHYGYISHADSKTLENSFRSRRNTIIKTKEPIKIVAPTVTIAKNWHRNSNEPQLCLTIELERAKKGCPNELEKNLLVFENDGLK